MVFLNREAERVIEADAEMPQVRLRPDTFEAARRAAPGWDIYQLELEWRSWMSDGGLDAPKDADRAFLGFCRKWYEKRGAP